jgi:DNA polymerase
MSICKRILLTKQIDIIQPKVICTLGAAAFTGLLENKTQITQVRGTPIRWHNITILPTFHPAYILRNPKELETFCNDLQQAAQLSK